MQFFKNDRRLSRLLNTVPSFFISFSFFQTKLHHFQTSVRTPIRHDRKAHFRWDQELPLVLRRRSERSTVNFTRRATQH
jgi:hypothetical protein